MLYVVAGISRDDGETFDYFVSELSLESSSMTFLARLPAVFM